MGFCGMFLDLGLMTSWYGPVIAASTIVVPFGVAIFIAFRPGVPEELLAAARADAASARRTFWSVVLPVSRNAVVTVSRFAYPWAWSGFVFAGTLDCGGDPSSGHPRHAIRAAVVVAPSCLSPPSGPNRADGSSPGGTRWPIFAYAVRGVYGVRKIPNQGRDSGIGEPRLR
jgi:hypothetical protein